MGLGHHSLGPWGTIYANIHYLDIISSAPSATTENNWGAMYIRGTDVYVKIGGTEYVVSGFPHNHSQFGDIFGVNITAGTHLSGSVNTSSGTHTQTIDHIVGAGSYHLPALGNSGQFLANTGSGQVGWVDATAHGAHGSHLHSSSYSYFFNTVYANYLDNATSSYIKSLASIDPYTDGDYGLGSNGYRWLSIYTDLLVETSDARVKTDIQDLTNTNSLTFIDSLRPRSYKRLDKAGEPIDIVNYGLVAQEVEEALTGLNIDKTKLQLIELPDTETHMAVIDRDGNEAERPLPRGLSYMQLIAPLIGAVKELKARIEVLEGL
jgi:hypothetical protein